MRAFFLSAVLIVVYQAASAQACQEVTLFTNGQQKEIISDYIKTCYQNHYFFEDKGVVTITVYQDATGHNCWRLSALVDNRFLASPPKQYTWSNNDVILVYQGDSSGKSITASSDQSKSALINCLTELVGSRVYTYASGPQYAYDTDAKGNKKRLLIKHDVGGNIHNELIIIFNSDGTFTKKIPA